MLAYYALKMYNYAKVGGRSRCDRHITRKGVQRPRTILAKNCPTNLSEFPDAVLQKLQRSPLRLRFCNTTSEN